MGAQYDPNMFKDAKSAEYDGDFYKQGKKKTGFGGMSNREKHQRTTKQTITEHLDGSKTTVVTTTETSERNIGFSAANAEEYKIGMKGYADLMKPMMAQNTPLHTLAITRAGMMEELTGKIERSTKPLLLKSGE